MNSFKLNKADKKIAGVCSGLSKYFNVDVTLLRVGFICLTLATGFVPFALLYIILALVAPEEDNQ
jgi:phage shock protein PspC (stress-responsive transcriptional regulator)